MRDWFLAVNSSARYGSTHFLPKTVLLAVVSFLKKKKYIKPEKIWIKTYFSALSDMFITDWRRLRSLWVHLADFLVKFRSAEPPMLT